MATSDTQGTLIVAVNDTRSAGETLLASQLESALQTISDANMGILSRMPRALLSNAGGMISMAVGRTDGGSSVPIPEISRAQPTLPRKGKVDSLSIYGKGRKAGNEGKAKAVPSTRTPTVSSMEVLEEYLKTHPPKSSSSSFDKDKARTWTSAAIRFILKNSKELEGIEDEYRTLERVCKVIEDVRQDLCVLFAGYPRYTQSLDLVNLYNRMGLIPHAESANDRITALIEEAKAQREIQLRGLIESGTTTTEEVLAQDPDQDRAGNSVAGATLSDHKGPEESATQQGDGRAKVSFELETISRDKRGREEDLEETPLLPSTPKRGALKRSRVTKP